LHHWRQSLALSFLCACTFGLMIALLIPTVWLLLTRDRAELALSSSQVIAVIFLLVAAALAVAGLAGMFTAARGSMRPLPV
jgi:Na+-driven multidrug efflux pump